MRGYLQDSAARNPGPRRFMTLARRRHRDVSRRPPSYPRRNRPICLGPRSGIVGIEVAVPQQGIDLGLDALV